MDRYHLQHLVPHLFRAQRFDDIYELVEDPVWRDAKLAELDSDAGFFNDLQFAVLSAEGRAENLPRLFQYSLLETLLRAMAAEVPAASFEFPQSSTSLEPALERAASILDPKKQVEALISVARAALQTGQGQTAGRAIRQAEAAIEEVSGVYVQARLMVQLAAVHVDAGQRRNAVSLLERVDRLLEDSLAFDRKLSARQKELYKSLNLDANTKPPGKGSKPFKPVISNSQLEQSLSGLMNLTGSESSWRSTGGILALEAGLWAHLGQLQRFVNLLERLKPAIRQLDGIDLYLTISGFSVVDGINEAVLQLVRWGDAEQGRQILDLLPSGKVSPVYGHMQKLARELLRMGQTKLALYAVNKMGGREQGWHNRLLAELAPLVRDRESLDLLAGAAATSKGQDALNAVANRYAELGFQKAAQDFALEKAGPEAIARLAAGLILRGDPNGDALLQRALQAGRSISQPHKKQVQLYRVARGLAAGGQSDRALAVWKEAQKVTPSRENPVEMVKTAAAVGACLAREGRLQQAFELANSLKEVSGRVEALAGIGVTLHEAGKSGQAKEAFQSAYAAARRTVNLENRADALDALLDGLLAGEEFDLAMQVARDLDRLSTLDSVAMEPSLVFRKAKGFLARKIGLPEDEDLAIDTAPDYQVKVIIAIAEAGDYRRAYQLAEKITNISVQEEMLGEIAEAAARTGSYAEAHKIAGKIPGSTERETALEEIAGLAAQSGRLSKALLENEDYRAGKAAALTALAFRLSSRGKTIEAQKLLTKVSGELIDASAGEADQAVEKLGELIDFSGRLGYAEAVRFYLNETGAQIKRLERSGGEAQSEQERAWQELAEIVGGIGWAKEAVKIARRCPNWPDLDAEVHAEAALTLSRKGEVAKALGLADQLQNGDDIRVAAAFNLAGRGQFAAARQILPAIAGEAIRSETGETLSLLEQIGRDQERDGQMVAWMAGQPGELEDSTDDELAALIFRLVLTGQTDRAFALLKAIPQPGPGQWNGKRPVIALAILQASAQARQTVPGRELVELIDHELAQDAGFLAGLDAIAGWILGIYSQEGPRVLEPVYQAMQNARAGGHVQVLSYLSGLACLLDGLGGVRLVEQTLHRIEQVEEGWC